MYNSSASLCISFITILLSLALSSCIGDNSQGKDISVNSTLESSDFNYNSFPSSSFLAADTLALNELTFNPHIALMLNDSILLNVETIYGPDTLCSLINIKKANILQKFGLKGQGPGEFGAIATAKLNVEKNQLSFFDDVLQRITIYELGDLLNVQKSIPYRQISLYSSKQFMFDALYISDTLIIGTTVMGEGRFVAFNSIKNHIRPYGQLESWKPHTDFEHIKQQANEATFVYNAKENRLAFGLRYADKLEIFDRNENKSSVYYGPDKFPVKYVMENAQSTFPTFNSSMKAKIGYNSLGGNEKYLYGLYSGTSFEEVSEPIYAALGKKYWYSTGWVIL